MPTQRTGSACYARDIEVSEQDLNRIEQALPFPLPGARF
jgi:hypothetical protein